MEAKRSQPRGVPGGDQRLQRAEPRSLALQLRLQSPRERQWAAGAAEHRRARRAVRRVCYALTLLALPVIAGCDDALEPAQVIERTRVLGARASVVGDATRAWPRPG